MQEVKKIYQIMVVVTDEHKRMIVAGQGTDCKPELVLDLNGDEAVSRYHALIDLFCRPPTKN